MLTPIPFLEGPEQWPATWGSCCDHRASLAIYSLQCSRKDGFLGIANLGRRVVSVGQRLSLRACFTESDDLVLAVVCPILLSDLPLYITILYHIILISFFIHDVLKYMISTVPCHFIYNYHTLTYAQQIYVHSISLRHLQFIPFYLQE